MAAGSGQPAAEAAHEDGLQVTHPAGPAGSSVEGSRSPFSVARCPLPAAAQPAAEFVVIGHVTLDLTPAGPRAGGTACYAALVAARLGLRTALVTRAGQEPDLAALLPGVELYGLGTDQTAVFEHRFAGERRIEYVHARAAVLGPDDIPPSLRQAPIALLGPVLREVDPAIAAIFPQALLGATAQGWLRRLDADGLVSGGFVHDLDVPALAGRLTLLALSQEDLAGQALPPAWLNAFAVVAVTRGRHGLRLHWARRWWQLDAFPAQARDTTGAGDAFSAGFLIRYRETGDVAEAARFASVVASFVVEAPGISGAPPRTEVERRLNEHAEIRLAPLPSSF